MKKCSMNTQRTSVSSAPMAILPKAIQVYSCASSCCCFFSTAIYLFIFSFDPLVYIDKSEEEQWLVRKELLRLVGNMGSSVGMNANEQGLLRYLKLNQILYYIQPSNQKQNK